MLSFYVVKKDGSKMPLGMALTAVLDSDAGVPADSLTLTCPYEADIRENADSVLAYRDGGLVFAGKTDNLVTVKKKEGVIIKLNARSLAAGLVDNEAEPLVYNAPTAGLMSSRHLSPFGIELADGDKTPLYDKLTIEKGMSHWQVLKLFCRNRYGSVPFVTGDGKAYLKGFPATDKVCFAFPDGIPYYSLKESVRRHRLISEVRVKFRSSSSYRSYIKNPNPEAKGITRVRYVNAAAANTSLSTAYQMIENSNRDSYRIKLECAGCLAGITGRAAMLRDSVLGEIDGLRVKKVRYTLDSRGELSTITLVKEDFDVADELHN